jgi:hypothetical protein
VVLRANQETRNGETTSPPQPSPRRRLCSIRRIHRRIRRTGDRKEDTAVCRALYSPVLVSCGARLSFAFLFFLLAFFSSSSRDLSSSLLPLAVISSKCIFLCWATSRMPRSQNCPLRSMISLSFPRRDIKPSRLFESGMTALEALESDRSSYDILRTESSRKSRNSVSMVSTIGKLAVPGGGPALGVVLRLR